MPEVKCQNRKGMKCIQFRGKNIYYTTINDLASKLSIPSAQAKKLIEYQTRLIVDEDGKIEKINLKKNPFPLITREFNIKRIPNAKLTSVKPVQIKNSSIAMEFGENVEVEVIIIIKMLLGWNTDGDTYEESRSKELYYKGYVGDIKHFVNINAEQYAEDASAFLLELKFKIITLNQKKELKWTNGRLREDFVYNLTEYCNIIYSEDSDGNCVKNFLKEKYPKISKKYIDSLGNKKGVSIQEIIDFCKKYQIKCFIYNVLGKKKYESDDGNKSYSNLSFIAYNNHIYPLAHNQPKKVKKKKDLDIKIVDNCMDNICKLISKKIIPYDIIIDVVNNNPKTMSDINVISYVHNDKKYIANKEYIECKEILEKFDLQDDIYDSIKKKFLGSVIEKKFIKENIDSFFPCNGIFQKGGFLYKTKDKIDEDRDITTIDKNKAYTYCLYTLPYLIVCDWRVAEIIENPKNIVDNYLYIASPKQSTILIPNTNIYSGSFLKECKKYNVQFELLEEIKTTTVINRYKKMINTMINKKMPMKDIKDIINILIGKMERSTHVTNKFTFDGILNSDEKNTKTGYTINIDDDHVINFKYETRVLGLYNRKPISIQIKDQCRLLVFKKMNELKLQDKDIIQIKTDSITYYGKPPKDLDENNFHGWKLEEFNEIYDSYVPLNNEEVTFYFYNYKTHQKNLTRELHSCYAGSGKTYYIINELIPFLESKKIRYRVLTPSHSACDEYRKRGIVCDVIQKYTLHNSIPDEDYIIMDEIGFVDKVGHDLIYKLSQLDKSYSSLGDFGQLLPVNSTVEFTSKHYNDYLYNETNSKLTKNRRNNFPHSYYEDLKQNRIDIKAEVRKYSKRHWKNAEVILTYHNWVKEKYNKLMLKHLNKEEGDIGIKYICVTNDLLKKYGIYNHLQMTIINNKNNLFTLEDETEKIKATFTKKQLDKHFELAYALNAYQIQGRTIKSYYWAPEDDYKFDRKNGPRLAYTIISRLEGDVYKIDGKKVVTV